MACTPLVLKQASSSGKTNAFLYEPLPRPSAGNLLIGTCGSGGGGSNLLVAIKPPATQDASSEIIYEIPRSTAPLRSNTAVF